MTKKSTPVFYGTPRQTRGLQVMGLRGMVASGHYLASQAGMRMLHQGGNAVDAGVAAGMCLNVLLPYLTSLGGVAPIILYLAKERRVTTISGLGRWPRAATLETIAERGGGEIPRGVLRCVTPAALDAWVTALERYGRLSFAQVAQPALELAEGGFPVDASLHDALAALQPALAEWPWMQETFYPGGKPPAVGSIFRQPELATTLSILIAAEQNACAAGRERSLHTVRDVFYRGEIARRMVEFSRRQGGLLSMDDLAEFSVREEEPIAIEYKGYQVYACGAWCQGPAVLQTLQLLKGFDLPALRHNSAAYLHRLVEAVKLSYADRERYYGDPDFVRVPLEGLLSDGYAEVRRALIDPRRASPGMPAYGVPPGASAATAVSYASALGMRGPAVPQGDASYACAVDAEGNGFSATPSDFIGDVPTVPGLGFLISGRGAQSWLDPAHPSCIAPWKRPRLTPNPGLALRDGELALVFGTPGGDQQPQGMVQFFLNMAEFGMAPQEAVEQARVGSLSFPNSFWPHEYLPGVLAVESRLPAPVQQELAALGHSVQRWGQWEPRFGHVCAIQRDPATGTLRGAADPRFNTAAIGW